MLVISLDLNNLSSQKSPKLSVLRKSCFII